MQLNEFKKYVEYFLHLSTEEWMLFSSLFTELHVPKNSLFAKEGRYETKIGFLYNGIVRAFYRGKDGTEYNKTFFEPFEFIGAYSSLTTKQENKINIQALTDVQLLIADYSNIVALYDKHPQLERLGRLVAEHLFAIKEKREIELVLLDAAQRYEIFKKEYPTLENQISQYHIASYLGVSPTQLSRIRAKK